LSDPEIAIQNPNRYPEAAAYRVRPWLGELLGALAPEAASFGVRFAGDRALRRANRAFRGKDRATDVLSFPGAGGPEGWHLGDVLISVPTARRQAAAAGHPVARELKVLLLHGLLHCLGHDHEADGGAMERLERRLRRRWVDDA
jgi:probable rRNA maturation factor